MPPVDPNQVLMTGENSFIRLSPDGGKTMSDRTSHWRVLWCPSGAGHVLFIQSALTDGKVRVYSDNIAVARFIAGYDHEPYPQFEEILRLLAHQAPASTAHQHDGRERHFLSRLGRDHVRIFAYIAGPGSYLDPNT